MFIQEHPVEFIFIWDSIALTVYVGFKGITNVRTVIQALGPDPYDVEAHNQEAERLMKEETESAPMLSREGEPVRITSVESRPSWMN